MDEDRTMLSEEAMAPHDATPDAVAPADAAPADAAPADATQAPAAVAPDDAAPADATQAPADSTDPTAADVVPAPTADSDSATHHSLSGGDASLLALIDRLTALLERSDLDELEVESGSTSVILRKTSAVQPSPVAAAPTSGGDNPTGPAPAPPSASDGPHPAHAATGVERKPVLAPLTGIFYGAPSPGSAPYVKVGSEVAIGQVIGLIEAMKLFNEIKSDVAGRVAHIAADNGQLIKAKQPIIEVEPL